MVWINGFETWLVTQANEIRKRRNSIKFQSLAAFYNFFNFAELEGEKVVVSWLIDL